MTEINQELKGAVEAIIFVSEKSISAQELQNVFEGLDAKTITDIIKAIQEDYEARGSGIKLIQIAEGYQLVTSPHYANFVKKFYKIKHSEKLSMPSLETLSIIAYKQPVTKMEIEQIRGVNVDGVIKNLLEKGLIRIVGKKEVLGRPFVYGTTRSFLEYFGLNSLKELPDIEEFVEKIKAKEAEQEATITPIEEEELENIQTESKDITQEDPHQTVQANGDYSTEEDAVSSAAQEQEKETAIPDQEEPKNES